MTNTTDYKVGDTIEYYPFGSTTPRRVLVTARVAEQGNRYQPGFDGKLLALGSPGVWGYDSQVSRVVDEGVALLDRMQARGYDPARD